MYELQWDYFVIPGHHPGRSLRRTLACSLQILVANPAAVVPFGFQPRYNLFTAVYRSSPSSRCRVVWKIRKRVA
ncbi:hypothetical protein NPIL_617671, partial [Nephila pilipes]